MPLFSPLRWWQARRKQKRLDEAFYVELRQNIKPPNLDKMASLLQAGAKLETRKGTSPLALAARSPRCDAEVTRFLIENGADITHLNGTHRPGSLRWLPWAAHGSGDRKKSDKFRLLFEAGADVNGGDGTGRTVLWEMTAWASDDLIAEALKRGANPNTPGFGGFVWTPLHLAAHEGRAAVVTLYLHHGADPFVLDKNGNTPRRLAETREPITDWTERWAYVPDLDECARLLLAAEQENKG